MSTRYGAAAMLAKVAGELTSLVASGDNRRILSAYTELRRRMDAAERALFPGNRLYTVSIAAANMQGGYVTLKVITVNGRVGGWTYAEIIGALVGSVKRWITDYQAGRLAIGAHKLDESSLVRFLLRPHPSLEALLVENGIGHVRELYAYDPDARGLGTTLEEAEAMAETLAVLDHRGKGVRA